VDSRRAACALGSQNRINLKKNGENPLTVRTFNKSTFFQKKESRAKITKFNFKKRSEIYVYGNDGYNFM
jgi:hypothetical protein